MLDSSAESQAIARLRIGVRLDERTGGGEMKSGENGFLFDDIGGVEELVGLYANAVRTMIDAIPADLGTDEPSMGSREEIMMLLAKAQVAWLTSGLRYWKQIGEIVGKSGLGLMEVAAKTRETDGDPETKRTMQQLVLVDKARACLREVGEVSLSEAEALRRELQKIEAELRATIDPGPAPEGRRGRGHRTKQ